MLLRSAGRTEEGASLFTTLYRSWSHSVGAVLSLCFLSEVRQQSQPSILASPMPVLEPDKPTDATVLHTGVWPCVRAGFLLCGATHGRGGAGAD